MVGFQEAEINSASQRLLDSHLRQFANKQLIHMQVYWSNTICSLFFDVCRVRAIFQCITLLMFGMSDTYTAAEKLHDIVDDQVSLPFNLMPPKSMCILEFFTNGIHCV